MLTDDEFRRVLDHLNRPWAGFRKVRKGVKKRLRRHMHALACPSTGAYLDLIDRRPEVKAACERQLIVTISRFFRDRRLWAELRDRILPARVAVLEGPMRVWSAGCANGEEPYSLAIVWEEQATDHQLIVEATDINRQCLERAGSAVYSRSSLKHVPDALRRTYFDASSAGRRYTLKPLAKSVIRWHRRDLFGEPLPDRFHIIFLRNNLLTYYQGPDQLRAFERIVRTLLPGGCLVVGSHERPPRASLDLNRDTTCPWIYWRS